MPYGLLSRLGVPFTNFAITFCIGIIPKLHPFVRQWKAFPGRLPLPGLYTQTSPSQTLYIGEFYMSSGSAVPSQYNEICVLNQCGCHMGCISHTTLRVHRPPRVAVIEHHTVVHWPWQGALAANASEEIYLGLQILSFQPQLLCVCVCVCVFEREREKASLVNGMPAKCLNNLVTNVHSNLHV